MPKRTAKPCGSDILEAGIKSAVIPAGDGGTVIAGEITKQPYKPLRGDAGCFRCDRGAFAHSFCRGRIGARYPRALWLEGEEMNVKARAKSAPRD